ncbi:arsenical resistance protein ArsH [Halomonas sp. V046]|uniref:arsenical resistance protein ArsH n=1 Tax=Halomonas sp. V046 TaxID=3459611 RepID=UPI0040449C75
MNRLEVLKDLPNIDPEHWRPIAVDDLVAPSVPRHPLRLLVLYGSLRERSYSRFAAQEATRLLQAFGAEVRTFDPTGLPLPDGADAEHPKIAELRKLAAWSEGMMWVSPERHGAMSAVMKAQIDWLPLSLGGVRPTQGKTLALIQVCGGSQSFNAVNQMRLLGRWMRMATIPNQSSVPKAFNEFDAAGRMRLSPLYLRIVDVCEELAKFTWLMRGRSGYLTQRYSERVESAAALSQRVNQDAI